MNIDALLLGAKRVKASDVHMIEGQTPFFRIAGDMKKVDVPALSKSDFDEMLKKMMPTHMHREYESQRGADFGYQIGDEIRFRVVCYYEMGHRGIVMRLVPLTVPSIEELELPEVTRTIAGSPRGMILLTGMTGSGKSTTLAAMIDYINQTEAVRIITIEDPVEYVYSNKKAIISQREVGKDVPDFNVALRQAMRMDPDIVLVGEMRDVETIKVAIKAAETGHLVLSTLHTTSAVHTIQRVIGYFPESEHDLLREQLAMNLKASVTQRLVKRADGKGRLAAQEIMVVNSTIAKLMKENRIVDIFGVIKGRDDGMQTFDQGLADLVRANRITFDEGTKHCEDFYAYKRFIAGIASTGDKGAILA
ncbi:MAG: type IV pilus twitching motility protein PilT [Candidatus Sumerlaeaceae bacterium]